SQRGASLQPCLPAEVSAAGARSGTGEVRWAGGEAFWANADGRALGSRRWTAGECRDAAAVDAGSGAMEPGTEAAEAPQEARAEGAFRGTGADGRQLSRVVGRARSGWLFDRHGGRRDEYHVGAVRRAGNDLGGGRCFARMDRAIRSTAGAVRGLEEPVQEAGHAQGAVAGRGADHAVWAHVSEAGDRDHRCQFATGQGTRGAGTRHASRPAGEETTAERDH